MIRYQCVEDPTLVVTMFDSANYEVVHGTDLIKSDYTNNDTDLLPRSFTKGLATVLIRRYFSLLNPEWEEHCAREGNGTEGATDARSEDNRVPSV